VEVGIGYAQSTADDRVRGVVSARGIDSDTHSTFTFPGDPRRGDLVR